MYKIANQVLDAYDDTKRDILKKVAQKYGNLSMLTPEECDALPDHEFALSVITKKAQKLNKFPIDSRDSTAISNEYFANSWFKLPKEAASIAAFHIKSACERFGIEPTQPAVDMAKTASSNAYFERDVNPEYRTESSNPFQKFAEVEKIANNDTHAKFVFGTTEDLKTGSEYFDKFAEKMPLEIRSKYASALQRRAGELGTSLKGKIEKYAGNAYGAHVDAHLSLRKTLLKEATLVTALDKLAKMKDELSPMDFAQVLHGFDKHAGLTKYYDGFITDPFKSTFSSLYNEKCLHKTASGKKLTPEAITQLATAKYDKIKHYFGKTVADELKKSGADVFEALPADAKEVIAGIADGTL